MSQCWYMIHQLNSIDILWYDICWYLFSFSRWLISFQLMVVFLFDWLFLPIFVSLMVYGFKLPTVFWSDGLNKPIRPVSDSHPPIVWKRAAQFRLSSFRERPWLGRFFSGLWQVYGGQRSCPTIYVCIYKYTHTSDIWYPWRGSVWWCF